MSEQEKYWYQDGGIVLLILFVGAVLSFWGFNAWREYQFSQIPIILPISAGRLEQPLWGDPVLHVQVWHQFPGRLQKGNLIISSDSPMVVEGDQFQMHSFESWDPNRDHEVKLRFRLQNFNPKQEIPLTMRIEATNGRAIDYTPKWLGWDWKSNQEK